MDLKGFKVIPVAPEYMINDQGDIYSSYIGRLLRQKTGKNGYKEVSLVSNTIRTHYRVHVLVMLTFIGPRPNNLVIDHRNRNRADNRLSNLLYCTQNDNIKNSNLVRNPITGRYENGGIN